MRETSFNGAQTVEADELRANIEAPYGQQPPAYTSRLSTYFHMPEAQRILYEGLVDGDIHRDQPGALYSVESYDPSYEFRYDLEPGDRYEQTYEIEDDQTRSGLGLGDVMLYDAHTTIRYVGRETLTVPAGTFETCRLERLETYEPPFRSADVRTLWLGVGNGLLIREKRVISQNSGVTANYVTELVEAAIDGEPVRGIDVD